MSPQLEQVFNQAQQLSPQEQIELANRLFRQINGTNSDQDNRPEAELEYVNGVLVVKSQGNKLSGDLVAEMRDERMAQIEAAALATGLVERVEGGLVVKGQPGEVLDLDLVEFVKQGREERMEKGLGW